MKQTVVGVFETSEEARRAQAALLDAQFSPSAVRMSPAGALRGVDEGMAYPVGSARAIGAPDTPDAMGASAEWPRTEHGAARAPHRDNAIERVAVFLKGLFSSESQREELARYEEALHRGGALVAVDVDDEIEQSLASDILIRAGAYDLEERAAQWGRIPDLDEVNATLDPIPGSAQPMPIRSAAMPGNVTSMDPSDATGYRASRTDFSTGETWPASRTAFSGSTDRDLGSASAMSDERGPVRHEDLTHVRAGSGMASWEQPRTPSYPADMRDRVEDAMDTRDTRMARQSQSGQSQSMTSAGFGEERVQPQPAMSRAVPSPHMQTDSSVELDAPVMRTHALDRSSTQRPASQRPSTMDPMTHTHMSDGAALGGDMVGASQAHEFDADDLGNEVVSSSEASHLLASGCEVFLDDCGFARMRNGGRVRPIHKEEPTKIARNVRVYARRADDPASIRDAAMRDDSFTHTWSGEGGQFETGRQVARDNEAVAARDRRMMRASSRARDCDDARDTALFETRDTGDGASDWSAEPASVSRVAPARAGDETLGARDAVGRGVRRDPASGDWAADWAADQHQSWAEMDSPGPDELEADRLGDEAARRGAASMMGEPRSSMARRPTGAEDLARREAALREEALSDREEMAAQTRHPEWRDTTPADPSELARRQATLRDQTLQDYAAMDERAEMRAANAAAAARASVGESADVSGMAATGHAADLGAGIGRSPDLGASTGMSTPPESDMSAELGLHSPLEDRFGARRTALDDGAPLARNAYDDDDRRYAAQDDNDDASDNTFVDVRDPRHRSARATSEWRHMKQIVRDAWHKVTHPGRHH